MTRPRVVVIGGGITGLSLACTLKDEALAQGVPLDLTLLDAGAPGGHARTIVEDGFIVEGGPNGFLDREPETLDLVKALGLDSALIEARPEAKRRFIVRKGRLRRVPESPPTLITSDALSVRAKLRLLVEPFASGPPAGIDETVYDFARRRIGAEAAEMLVDAAVAGISAGDSRALSLRSQFPIMAEMERDHGSLIRALIARRKRGTGPSRLMSFTGGMATLVGTLTRRLDGVMRAHTAVRQLTTRNGAWAVTTAAGDVIEADRVVLAVSARDAAGLVRDLDPGLGRTLDAIPYSGVHLAALAYHTADVPRSLDGYGYLVTRPEHMATLGVVWESSLFPGRAPEGYALLRVFLGGARQPGMLSLDEPGARALACEELGRVMGITAAPARAWSFHWPSAIAQYTVGHDGRVAAIRAGLSAHHGLSVCGTSYDGVSFNHAIAAGRKAARAVLADLAAIARGHARADIAEAACR
jgi:protoporphyrinogen/coproporphyrinogen III oxidase